MKRLVLSSLTLLTLIILLAGCGSLRTVRGTGDIVSEEREVGRFSAVDLAGVGTVIVDFGEKEALRIEAEGNLLPYLESEVEGETLTLGIREGVNVIPTQAIFYYLTVANLDEITVSGLGNIDVPQMEGAEVAINVTGGGDINVEELRADQLDVLISGLGDLNIDGGEAVVQNITISGGGNYNARELPVDEVSVQISGLGSAAVWAREQLDANISGGGSVRYDGRPQVSKAISGLGEVVPAGGR
jgi:hypothetical protein